MLSMHIGQVEPGQPALDKWNLGNPQLPGGYTEAHALPVSVFFLSGIFGRLPSWVWMGGWMVEARNEWIAALHPPPSKHFYVIAQRNGVVACV